MASTHQLDSSVRAQKGRYAKRRRFERTKKWLAGTAAASLVASLVVFAGFTAQEAHANPFTPGVSVDTGNYLAGEDLNVSVTFGNSGGGPQYNLSAGLVLSEDVQLVDAGTLGSPRIFEAGDIITGGYTSLDPAVDCSENGLDTGDAGDCVVPDGMQYLVFQNVSDLPQGANVNHTLTLRPNAEKFPIGSTVDLQFSAYTSNAPRMIPIFPGTTGVGGAGSTHTSAIGQTDPVVHETEVKAFWVEKFEPSAESELLRGVHENVTTYTIRIHHTAEADISDTEVVDYLPAGLEYLGNDLGDNSAANEYSSSGPLNSAGPSTDRGGAWTTESSITTVNGSTDENAPTGEVYTRVVWDLKVMEALDDRNTTADAKAQDFAGNERGVAGYMDIKYRAGIPLFENTMDFAGTTPTPESREQGANLDNNNGPSTRHGVSTSDEFDNDARDADVLTNHVSVTGTYEDSVEGTKTHTEEATENVHAVDVRVLKSAVDSDEFMQGELAYFELNIARSEYVTVEHVGSPDRILDDLGDGICPALPTGTPITGGAEAPRFQTGNGRTGVTTTVPNASAWNDILQQNGVDADCFYGDNTHGATPLSGATLTAVTFNTETGHFYLDLNLDTASASTLGEEASPNSSDITIRYPVVQNTSYIVGEGEQGATTSGDSVPNVVEFVLTTTPTEATKELLDPADAGKWQAADDSDAVLSSPVSQLSKHVLKRGVAVVDPLADLPGIDATDWVKTPEESTPFAAGETVWYKLQVRGPAGADIRNPQLTDFLPAGVEFDPVLENGRMRDIVVIPSHFDHLAAEPLCEVDPGADQELLWLNKFAKNPSFQDNVLTWQLGTDCQPGVEDRFLPRNLIIDFYIKVTVTDVAAFGEVDLPENLAKYQQENVDGVISFERSAAEIEVGHQAGLVKGIVDINGTPNPANGFNSDIDGLDVRQGDKVTFRVDVAAPEYDTAGYQVWDALPVGIVGAGTYTSESEAPVPVSSDLSEFSAYLWDGEGPTAVTPGSVTVYNPGDAGRPDVTGDYEDRAIVVWNFGSDVVVPGHRDANPDPRHASRTGLTLEYTVTIPGPTAIYPDGFDAESEPRAAVLGQTYRNTASIVSYEIPQPGGQDPVAHHPDGPISDEAIPAGGISVTGEGTYDDSHVQLVSPDMDKSRVSTEIAPTGTTVMDENNPAGSVVQGELVTYDITATIPAHTTVLDGSLKDNGNLVGSGTHAYTLEDAVLWTAPGVTDGVGAPPAGFVLDTTTGELTFPGTYHNSTAFDQDFTVRITVWISQDLNPNTTLTNTAGFTFTDASGDPKTVTDTATVTYIEPDLRIAKTAAAEDAAGEAVPTDTVGVGDTITYSIVVSNPGTRPISYDNVVTDTIDPGLEIDLGSFMVGTVNVSDHVTFLDVLGDQVANGDHLADGLGGSVVWDSAVLSSASTNPTDALNTIPTSVTLTYTAKIDPDTGGGQSYDNHVSVDGYTLPSTLDADPENRRGKRTATADETITAITAAIDKGVRVVNEGEYTEEVSAPIGQTVEYEVLVTLHPNINYYDPIIRDAMQPGMALMTDSIAGPIEVDVNGDPLDTADVTVDGTWAKGISENAHTWTYNGDIEDASETRYLLMTYQVELSDAVPFNVNALPNVVDFSWNSVNDDESTRVPDIEDNANVEVLNPRIVTAKSVSNGTPNPGDTFTYTVTFTNNGNTPAYNMTFVDTIPENVIVTPSSITSNGVLAGTDSARGNSGGTITWTPEGPLSNEAPNNSVTYTYEATLVASDLIRDDEPVADLTNTVIVDRYESFPEGGRDYEPGGEEPGTSATAVVDPPFPHVVPSKTVTTTDIAYEGVPLSWTLKFENTGDGPVRDISVEDVLPLNWNYEEGTAQIRWNGASSWTDLTDPEILQSDVGDEFQETLTWDKDEIRSKSAFPSEPTRPILAAYSGTGTAPHLEIRFNAIPTSAALTEAGVTEDDGTEVPHVNTVIAIAEDMSGRTGNESRPTYAPGQGEDEAFIHAVDLHLQKDAIGGTAADASGEWIAGQAAGDGYTQPQWKITITNQGPDVALGQFRVVDTVTQLDGVQTGPFSARYFADAADTTGTPITLTGSGTTSEPYFVGTSETSLQPDGSDRIELIANVTIAADATGTATNEADVTGRTYEPEDKITDGTNEDEATKTLTTLADLTINKAVNTVNPRAGENVTWQLDVRNLGPSVSVSSGDSPITVNDTVPIGITVTQNPSTTLWTATVDGGAFPAEGVTGGTEIVWVYQGDEMSVNVTSSILLTGMIDPAWEPNAELTNEAQVVPGETEDPNFGTPESNNEDTVIVTPGTTTSLGIAKTRVVQQGSGWTNAVDLDPVPPIIPGESVSYRIDVVNNGPAVARNVTVVDESPEGFTYTGIHNIPGSTWNWLDTGAAPTENQTFALADNQAVGPTNMKSFVVTFDTDEALDVSEPVVNTAIADADNSTNQPEDDDSSNSERNGNLFIEKTHTGDAVAGSTLPYTITVTNEGPSVSGGPIEVTDTLPGGFSYVAGSATASVAGGAAQALDTTLTVLDDGKQHLAWAIGDADSSLAVGATIVITFTSAIDPALGAQTGLINYATVDGPDNNDPSDDTDEDPTDVETRANMSITKLVEDGPWVAGTEVEYLLTVTNEGPSALDATVTDVLPAGLQPVSMAGLGAGNAWDCSATSCLWETYPVGSSQILVTAFIESGVEQGTDLLNTATVNWEDSDGPHEDSDDEEINVSIIADLGLKKHVLATPSGTEWLDANSADDAGIAVAGEATSFKLTVSNEGPSDAVAPLVVSDTLPQGIAFDTITVGEGWEADYDEDANVVTFTNDSTGIAYGADALEIEYSVTLAPEMELGAVTNEAEITSETLDANNDGNPDNDADPANVDVEREVDVAIVKTHNPDVVRIGDELPFALEVTNNGPSNASGVIVTDTVPAGLDVVVDTEALPVEAGEGWTIDAVTENEDGTTTVVASYADELEPFEAAPILTITTLVTPVAYETVTNVAVVDTTEPDRVPENNTTEDPVIVPPMVTLVVEKNAVGEFQVGKTGTYRITVENFGPTADPGPITVTDVLPNGLTFHSSSDETVDVNGTEVTWTIEEGLGVDERVELTLVVNVHQAAYPSVTNVVSVDSPAEKTPESVLSDDETVEVKAADPLAVTGGELALSGLLALLIVLMLGGGAALMIRRRTVEA